MFHQTLSGQWTFHQRNQDEWLPATVPGGVHTDLLALGKIPDPFVADWEYYTTFSSAPDLLKEAKLYAELNYEYG